MKELTIKDLRRDIEQAKKRLSAKKVTENFGASEIRKLEDKYFDLSMYDRSAYHRAMSAFEDWCQTYTGIKSSKKIIYPKEKINSSYVDGLDYNDENEELAMRFGEAIKQLGNDENRLNNFISYLTAHGDDWFTKFCKDYRSLISEFITFSTM